MTEPMTKDSLGESSSHELDSQPLKDDDLLDLGEMADLLEEDSAPGDAGELDEAVLDLGEMLDEAVLDLSEMADLLEEAPAPGDAMDLDEAVLDLGEMADLLEEDPAPGDAMDLDEAILDLGEMADLLEEAPDLAVDGTEDGETLELSERLDLIHGELSPGDAEPLEDEILDLSMVASLMEAAPLFDEGEACDDEEILDLSEMADLLEEAPDLEVDGTEDGETLELSERLDLLHGELSPGDAEPLDDEILDLSTVASLMEAAPLFDEGDACDDEAILDLGEMADLLEEAPVPEADGAEDGETLELSERLDLLHGELSPGDAEPLGDEILDLGGVAARVFGEPLLGDGDDFVDIDCLDGGRETRMGLDDETLMCVDAEAPLDDAEAMALFDACVLDLSDLADGQEAGPALPETLPEEGVFPDDMAESFPLGGVPDISDEQLERVVTRVIHTMFKDQIEGLVVEAVGRSISEEMGKMKKIIRDHFS